ncbi:MAG: GNAT family N-acetyltransferase [Anaerolineae bacterium]|jgi:GNAT superfamily N-acetyltransferase|nr:GNAT family N-acetyltransferase [Anaerolineae bacterium]
MIEVRALETSDQAFIWEMLYHAVCMPNCPPPSRCVLEQPDIARYAAHWGDLDDCGVIAIDRETGQKLGAAWLRVVGGYGFMDDTIPELTIAMIPEARGQGIGTQLMSALMQCAEGRYEAITLTVSPQNPAKRLYERFGFQVSGGCGCTVTMIKHLMPIAVL